MLDPELQPERERVAAAARRLAAEGLVLGTAGNVSHRAGGAVLVTPTGGVLETLEAADVAAVEIDGRPLPGSTEPTSEIDLHLGAIVRYGAGAVVHTHSPAATALSCVVDEVPVVHYGMLALRGALMASHGAVVYAGDVEEAVELALLLEWACEVYWRASLIGTPRVLGSAE